MSETPDFFTNLAGTEVVALRAKPEPFTQRAGNGQMEVPGFSINLSASAKAPDQRPTRDGEQRLTASDYGGRIAEKGQTSLGAQLFTNQKEGDAECFAPAATERLPFARFTEQQPSNAGNAAPKFEPLVAAANGSTVGCGTERQIVALDKPKFQGETFDPNLDSSRLNGQLKRVRELMKDNKWRTLFEIEQVTGDPQASVSARLRDLRRPRFGMYTVARRRRAQSLWEYQMRGRGI